MTAHNGHVRVVLIVRRTLDLTSLSGMLGSEFTLLATENNLSRAISLCECFTPDIALLDATFPDNAAFAIGESLIVRRHSRAVLFLDDDIRIARAEKALRVPNSAYSTRCDDLPMLCTAMRRLVGDVDAQADEPLVSTPDRFLDWCKLRKIDQNGHVHGYLDLTDRQREVLNCLARGNSVNQTAVMLGISRCTVDNHKTRLMRTLGFHRSNQLVNLAHRVGLID
jgi:two-component system, NarL family, response regulator NreC